MADLRIAQSVKRGICLEKLPEGSALYLRKATRGDYWRLFSRLKFRALIGLIQSQKIIERLCPESPKQDSVIGYALEDSKLNEDGEIVVRYIAISPKLDDNDN